MFRRDIESDFFFGSFVLQTDEEIKVPQEVDVAWCPELMGHMFEAPDLLLAMHAAMASHGNGRSWQRGKVKTPSLESLKVAHCIRRVQDTICCTIVCVSTLLGSLGSRRTQPVASHNGTCRSSKVVLRPAVILSSGLGPPAEGPLAPLSLLKFAVGCAPYSPDCPDWSPLRNSNVLRNRPKHTHPLTRPARLTWPLVWCRWSASVSSA